MTAQYSTMGHLIHARLRRLSLRVLALGFPTGEGVEEKTRDAIRKHLAVYSLFAKDEADEKSVDAADEELCKTLVRISLLR